MGYLGGTPLAHAPDLADAKIISSGYVGKF